MSLWFSPNGTIPTLPDFWYFTNARSKDDFALLREDYAVITRREFSTKTGGRFDALDVTDDVRAIVEETGVSAGVALIFSPHTTCCIEVGERDSILAALTELEAKLAPEDGYYAHDDFEVRTENLVENEPANAPAHVLHAFAGSPSVKLPVKNGELDLNGARILFVELDGSRPRRYLVQVQGG